MMFANVFCARLYRLFAPIGLGLIVVFLLSCTGKHTTSTSSSEEVELMDDSDEDEEADTLVYESYDAPLTDAVDESFLDFLFTFTYRRAFQLERVAYPIEVRDEDDEVVDVLKNGRSISNALHFSDYDYFVMVMNENEDPYDYMNREVKHAEVHEIKLDNGWRDIFVFDKQEDDTWKFTGINRMHDGIHDDFFHFFGRFVNDSIFQDEHLASEMFISIPSNDDDMEMVNGNIDPGQWEVFAPEMPHESVLLLDMGDTEDVHRGVKLVKCSLASSMMEVFTFEREDNEWKLVRYEE